MRRLGRDVAGFYTALALIAFWASFGPDAGLYRLLFETVPVFAFLRAPARMGIIVTLALVVLSAAAAGPVAARRAPGRGCGPPRWRSWPRSS